MVIKKLILLTSMLLVSISLFSQAKMVFKETTVNFGEIDAGKVIDVAFEFENQGDAPLIIKKIKSSCGCLASKLEKNEFKPGEKGIIPVKFYSRGYNGRIIKSITVSSNSDGSPYISLRVAGNVKLKDFAQIQFEPSRLSFGKTELNQVYKKEFSIKNTGTITLKIYEVTHNPMLSVEFPAMYIKPGESITVPVSFRPMEKKSFTTFIKVKSNAYRHHVSVVKVTADIE